LFHHRLDSLSLSSLSLLLLRLPRLPTLFPYTTLFRSSPADPASPPAATDVRCARRCSRGALGRRSGALGDHGGERREDLLHLRRDRKSTRLNSSHVKTSYAVFCLKKKIISYHCIYWVS